MVGSLAACQAHRQRIPVAPTSDPSPAPQATHGVASCCSRCPAARSCLTRCAVVRRWRCTCQARRQRTQWHLHPILRQHHKLHTVWPGCSRCQPILPHTVCSRPAVGAVRARLTGNALSGARIRSFASTTSCTRCGRVVVGVSRSCLTRCAVVQAVGAACARFTGNALSGAGIRSFASTTSCTPVWPSCSRCQPILPHTVCRSRFQGSHSCRQRTRKHPTRSSHRGSPPYRCTDTRPRRRSTIRHWHKAGFRTRSLHPWGQ